MEFSEIRNWGSGGLLRLNRQPFNRLPGAYNIREDRDPGGFRGIHTGLLIRPRSSNTSGRVENNFIIGSRKESRDSFDLSIELDRISL